MDRSAHCGRRRRNFLGGVAAAVLRTARLRVPVPGLRTRLARAGGSAAWTVKIAELAADEIAEIDDRFAALAPYLAGTGGAL